MPSGLGGRAEFYVNTSYLVSKDLLAAITLIGYGAGEGGIGPEPSVGWDLISAQWLSSTEGSSVPVLLEQKP